MDRNAIRDRQAVVKAAKETVGMSRRQLNLLADSDGTRVKHFDEVAQELASMYPELLGSGDRHEDPSARLWDLLQQPAPVLPKKAERARIRQAAELVANSPPHVYAPDLRFSEAAFARWLGLMDIPWPRLESGHLDLSDGRFRERAKAHPAVSPLRETRHALSQLRLSELSVGADSRNRCLLSAFASKTGRNQPSSSRFIFGPSVWLRCLIQPEPGYALAYCDWAQQEFEVAAAVQ